MHKILLYLLLLIKLSSCERRITNGTSVDFSADTSFVVYIISAKTTDIDPGWLCGGSVIHPSLVLTSAACLRTGVKQMYVIAGYRKYVNTERLELDACTRHMKKRIVSYCVHQSYATESDDENKSDERKYKWLKFDIGIAKIDSPIDLYDTDYIKYCSYIPTSIRTNYNSRYENPSGDVVVYGWGHAAYYRPEGDLTDYNEVNLKYAASLIISRKNCIKYFRSEYVMTRIQDHFICTEGKGLFNAAGILMSKATPTMKSCNGRRSANNSAIDSHGTSCVEDNEYNKTSDNASPDTINSTDTRRNGICQVSVGERQKQRSIHTAGEPMLHLRILVLVNGILVLVVADVFVFAQYLLPADKGVGAFQNDHGNPLVRWIGGRPYVIGVASAFQVNKNMQCVGPYLYSSILCTSRFISCMLQEQYTVPKETRRTTQCDDPVIGYNVQQTEIDWSDDEDF